MKKIIAAFDGLKYSTATRDYAIALTNPKDTHLVGVFMEDPYYTGYKIYDLIEEKGGVSELKRDQLDAKDKTKRNEAVSDFEKYCTAKGLQYTVHHDHKTPIRELKHESIYADLLIINASETLSHHSEKLPTYFIRDLLTDTQCPVLIVPKKYIPVKKIVLLYDGAPSSVYAVKMFSYLLPQLKDLETAVISVNAPDANLHMPDNKLMKEFMKRHFPKAKFIVKKGNAEEEIIRYLKEMDPDTMVVLGAYRRGTVSRWFKESMADVLMKEIKLPLFVAHNK